MHDAAPGQGCAICCSMVPTEDPVFIGTPGPGQPGLPTRLVAGLWILKHMHNLSDEVLCARWLENPYYQSAHARKALIEKPPIDLTRQPHQRMAQIVCLRVGRMGSIKTDRDSTTRT